jgi:hypothetical protein
MNSAISHAPQPQMTSPTDIPVRKRWWHAADRVGALASFLCAVHCAALPFVLVFLPLLGLQFLADHAFERGFVSFACVLATITLIGGYRRHRRPLALALVLPGLLLLILGITVLHDGASLMLHSVLVTCGGLLVASAHFVNLRFDRIHHVHDVQCAH